MTAPTKTLRTPAEAGLVERFAEFGEALTEATETKRVRQAAFAQFERWGLPHRRVEAWKYSDLRARLKSAVSLTSRPTAAEAVAAVEYAADAFAPVDRFRLVMVDGYFVAALSDCDALLGEGVEVAALSDLLATEGGAAAGLFAVPEIAGEDVAVALNTAFAADGVVVVIAAGARLSKPIEILNVVDGSSPSAVYGRNRVVAGDGAVATVVETSVGGCEGSEVNVLTEYRAADGAGLTVARLQATDPAVTHITTNLMRLGEHTQVKHLSAEAGAGFSRNQTFVTFAGEHAEVEILGISLLDHRRHIDQTLVVDHAVPNCVSTELFKTVVDDQASGVFQGKIIVRPDAQKTNGKMMSQALLLSEEAEMAAKPELEIFADDVVCGHGATSGQIDAAMLFYLMARGIPRREAERLLIEAFLADPVDSIGDDAIAGAIKGVVSAWLAGRSAARREAAS
jgi:Fe-S cluster assembly protein SufD